MDTTTTIYFFTAWSGMPQNTKPQFFWVSDEEARQEHPRGAEAFIEQVINADPMLFIAVQTVVGHIPTCLCCHEWGKRHEHMATLFHWDAKALRTCKANGVVTATIPMPLDADDIEFVFCQLSAHPSYLGQKVVAISKDNEIIELQGDHIHHIEPS